MAFYEHASGAHRIAAAYDERLVPWLFLPWVDRLMSIAKPAPSAQVVDLACGTGLIARSALDHLDNDGRVRAVDADASMLAFAAGRTTDPRVSWHDADAAKLPFASSSIDAVICNQGLQFFPDRPAVLAEVSRVLRPGGRLALAVWGRLERNPWPASMAISIGDALGEDARRGGESVCALGDPDEVEGLIGGAGFSGVEVAEVELTAKHTDATEAIDGQLAALPSAAAIDALGPTVRSRLITNMAARLGPWIDGQGALGVPSTSIVAGGTRD